MSYLMCSHIIYWVSKAAFKLYSGSAHYEYLTKTNSGLSVIQHGFLIIIRFW